MTIRESIGEALSQGLCRGVVMAGWDFMGAQSLRTFTPGRPLVLKCCPETTGLEFLRHGWSGAVRIVTDAGEQIVPLANDEGTDVVQVELPPHDGDFEVVIEALPVAGREPMRCETWLLGAGFSGVPRPVGRSVLLNSRVKAIYGDWGEFLVMASDQVIPNAILREGSWAPRDIELFEEHIGTGDLVLDIGANLGHHSVVFSKLVGPSGLVIAIEAQRVMYQLVHANAVLNRCENIIPLHAAAGNAHGTVTMYPVGDEGSDNFGALGINVEAEANRDGGEEVEVHPLDDMLPTHTGGRRVAFVKIDVQSYELFVLQGMRAILAQDRPTIFIEISPYWMRRAGYDFREIYALLRDFGYSFVHREGIDLAPDGVPDVAPDQDIEWDLLAVHPESPDRV